MHFEEVEYGGDDFDDVDTQKMIEQSLLGCNKEIETRDSSPKDVFSQNTKDNVKIFSAIRKGDEATLHLLSVNQRAFSEADNRGWIPLHEAASQKNQDILKVTFEASTENAVECRTLRGKTPLFLAVEQGLIENATFLLENGSSPDCQDDEEDSPLIVAVRNDRRDLAKLLLAFGSNVNLEGCHCRTALHEAAKLGRDRLVRLLLRSGAGADPRFDYGLTPLALAAQCGYLEVVQVLLKKGANVESMAQDNASILFEASASGNSEIISLLLEYGADANIPKHTGHLPIHRVSHRGHLKALELLLPVTTCDAVYESGMSPLHSAAAGGHTQCLQALLKAGYDPNFMLHPWVRRNYEDERKSALYFAVSNDDVPSVKMLLEAGAMPNQDPVKCLQVALRSGNLEMINILLRFGANVNYFSRINTTHFPSALQYALKDEIILRMLCNYGYDVKRCFDCNYGEMPHVPDDYEGWSNAVIKDSMFCEVISVFWLKEHSGHVVRILMDYLDHVTFCSKLKATLMETKQWTDICKIQENARSLQHLCRLKIRSCLGRLRLRAPVFMNFLPLPDRLKDYILYREYDLYRQNSQVG
ncbi:dynein heavy chain 12, axonemal isoform X2 [Esox lucius]|uniref:dynein heavy chain 12, axonemal isoform X2 n=1 Tax=Esox lucius TaxID=8010 RepID=UPI001476D950|nr:dynein heavy chain 12, axonemal isoform X2 [Esox lucius]XP_010880397.2 dynein heavy chain 12, axonemal isoform X2 [Esox lucius]XP_010880398.2 dynein heavy chain 12, axonemal isoform X2 [Esox lucius]XP_034142922.1 dynein heavy chain 12, axonemal isoform X2 [Esox lucius]